MEGMLPTYPFNLEETVLINFSYNKAFEFFNDCLVNIIDVKTKNELNLLTSKHKRNWKNWLPEQQPCLNFS